MLYVNTMKEMHSKSYNAIHNWKFQNEFSYCAVVNYISCNFFMSKEYFRHYKGNSDNKNYVSEGFSCLN